VTPGRSPLSFSTVTRTVEHPVRDPETDVGNQHDVRHRDYSVAERLPISGMRLRFFACSPGLVSFFHRFQDGRRRALHAIPDSSRG
jgi:hypothetical protein